MIEIAADISSVAAMAETELPRPSVCVSFGFTRAKTREPLLSAQRFLSHIIWLVRGIRMWSLMGDHKDRLQNNDINSP